MIDITSSAHQFRRAVAEGDFEQSLGVSHDARKLDIDVAAARLADANPELADRISSVADVLTKHDRKAVYVILARMRDQVLEDLAEQYGKRVFEAIPDCRREVWKRCQQLLCFDLNHAELLVGPTGAGSLAERGKPWIIHALLEDHLPSINCSSEESSAGLAVREVWHAVCPICRQQQPVLCGSKRPVANSVDQLEPAPVEPFAPDRYEYELTNCRNCAAHGVDPSVYDDTYVFSFSADATNWSVVEGTTGQTGTVMYALLNGPTPADIPSYALDRFYAAQATGEDVELAAFEAAISCPQDPQVMSESSNSFMVQAGQVFLTGLLILAGIGLAVLRDSHRRGYKDDRPSFKPIDYHIDYTPNPLSWSPPVIDPQKEVLGVSRSKTGTHQSTARRLELFRKALTGRDDDPKWNLEMPKPPRAVKASQDAHKKSQEEPTDAVIDSQKSTARQQETNGVDPHSESRKAP